MSATWALKRHHSLSCNLPNRPAKRYQGCTNLGESPAVLRPTAVASIVVLPGLRPSGQPTADPAGSCVSGASASPEAFGWPVPCSETPTSGAQRALGPRKEAVARGTNPKNIAELLRMAAIDQYIGAKQFEATSLWYSPICRKLSWCTPGRKSGMSSNFPAPCSPALRSVLCPPTGAMPHTVRGATLCCQRGLPQMKIPPMTTHTTTTTIEAIFSSLGTSKRPRCWKQRGTTRKERPCRLDTSPARLCAREATNKSVERGKQAPAKLGGFVGDPQA